MKKCLIAGTSLILAFAFCFVCIGYAQLVDTLTITGKMEVTAPQALYITKVEVSGTVGNGIATQTCDYEFPTTVNTSASFKTTNRTSRTVTYAITVKNNTRYKYVYKGYEAAPGATITSDLTSITTKYENGQAFQGGQATVAPGETLTFYATYQYNNSRNLNGKSTSAEINYKFGIHVDSLGDLALERVLIRFGEILNTDSTYQDLITHIDDKYVNQDWQANYIGNVWGASGAHSADTQTVERLFGEQLSLTMDGVTKNITLLIKRDNFDNNERTGDAYVATNGGNRTENKGCEMVLYMTANNLDKNIDAGEYSADRNQADVYIAVFTCQSDANGKPVGDWYQIGDVYKGYAPIVSYDGSANGTGSFVTDDWTSIRTTYKVTSQYSYTIDDGNGRYPNQQGTQDIREILPQVDVNAVNEYNRLLNIAQREIDYINANADYFNEDVFTEPIAKLQETHSKASSMTVNNRTPRAHIIKILKELENAVYPFLSYIGEN